MAVTFTTNLALAKPDGTELAENWVNNTKLQEDNNLIIIDQADINLVSYTPVVGAQTTAPNLGTTGSVSGEYMDVQGIIFGSFIITFGGTGITVGSGEYGISLPFPVDGTYYNSGSSFDNNPGSLHVIGEGYIFDSSAVATSGSVALDTITVAGVSYVRLLTELFTAPAKTSRQFRDSMPFAVADSDRFIGSYVYKRA